MVQHLTAESGRIVITLEAITVGDDLCVIIYGGDNPHIGCVALSIPRPSLKDASIISTTTSVLNIIGHKDDEVARYVSYPLSSKLNKNVVVTCGIHVDNITNEEIKTTITLLKSLTDRLIQKLKYEYLQIMYRKGK
jgi:gallate decarboxylase subunit D